MAVWAGRGAFRRRWIVAACLAASARALAGSAGPPAVSEPSAPTSADTVDAIVVTSRKLDVETTIDRKIYRVTGDPQATFGTASDILAEIPSIDVDPDGVVSLRGDSHVLVLIDGKPSTQFQGSAAGDNLQSLSALDIERIEVLTTPPPQFKADGAAGVINIITRKHRVATSSGTLQGSLGDGGRSLVAASGATGGERYSASLSAGYREDYRQRLLQTDVHGTDPATGQFQSSHYQVSERLRRNVPNVGASGEFDPNDREAITGSASWSRRGGLRTYTQLDTITDATGALTSATRRLSSGHDPENDYDVAVKLSQKLATPGETLDLSTHRSLSHQHEHYDYVNDSFVPPAPTFYDNLAFTEDNGITEAGLDYVRPLSKTRTLKLGAAFERDDYGFDNVGANVDPITGLQTVDPSLTNEFRFRQTIDSAYQSYQASVGAWSWLGGLREEYTATDARQPTSGQATPGHYFEVYPSLHADYGLSDSSTLSFGASRRVTRPDPSNLNPFVDHEYTPNLRAGNPDLRPQFTQSLDVGYEYEAHGASYAVTGYYRRNTDSVTDLTEYLGNGFSLTTKANLPRNDSAGFEFSANGRLTRTLAYSLSGDAFYSQIDASALGVPGLQSTTGLNLKAKLDYRPTAKDSAQATFSRTDKRLTPQGNISAIDIVNLGYRRTVSARLAAVATVSDLFNGQRYQRYVATPTFTQVYQRGVEGRIVFVGLVYSYGAEKKDKGSGFDYEPAN